MNTRSRALSPKVPLEAQQSSSGLLKIKREDEAPCPQRHAKHKTSRDAERLTADGCHVRGASSDDNTTVSQSHQPEPKVLKVKSEDEAPCPQPHAEHKTSGDAERLTADGCRVCGAGSEDNTTVSQSHQPEPKVLKVKREDEAPCPQRHAEHKTSGDVERLTADGRRVCGTGSDDGTTLSLMLETISGNVIMVDVSRVTRPPINS